MRDKLFHFLTFEYMYIFGSWMAAPLLFVHWVSLIITVDDDDDDDDDDGDEVLDVTQHVDGMRPKFVLLLHVDDSQSA